MSCCIPGLVGIEDTQVVLTMLSTKDCMHRTGQVENLTKIASLLIDGEQWLKHQQRIEGMKVGINYANLRLFDTFMSATLSYRIIVFHSSAFKTVQKQRNGQHSSSVCHHRLVFVVCLVTASVSK